MPPITDANEEALFIELYKKHYNSLIKFARYQLHSQIDSEEAVQNAFIIVIKHIDKYATYDDMKRTAYLFQQTKWECYKLLEKNRKQGTSHSFNEEILEKPSTIDDRFFDAMEMKFLFDEVMERLHKMPDIDCTLFLLNQYYGIPASELSGKLSLSENNIWVKIHRIKRKLLTQLEGDAHNND